MIPQAIIASILDAKNQGVLASTTIGRAVVSLNRDLVYQYRRGVLPATIHFVLQGVNEIVIKGKPINDRQLLLEHGVSFLQNLPPGSDVGKLAANKLIEFLWYDLPHPPASHIGKAGIYRSADGSGNNDLLPELGRSNRPYARSVPASLPDPALVFDGLLRRPNDAFKPHPSGISSLFFAFATIVIHECFQTGADDWWINEYVDLSTLYGVNQEEQDTVRTRNGFGTLYNDCFASKRLMMMTPAVCTLLIIFSRNHNLIAERLLAFNEKGTYVKSFPTTGNPTAASGSTGTSAQDPKAIQDEDIFQIARNINVAWFAHIVLGDYVATILNTPRAKSLWALDLGGEIIGKAGRLERGGGNSVSIEFNIAYHWHASMSKKDAAWIDAVFTAMFDGKDLNTVTSEEFYTKAKLREEQLKKQGPRNWKIHNLTRDATTGRYANDDLVKILNTAINEPAGAFGAFGSPAALKERSATCIAKKKLGLPFDIQVVEVMGMWRARQQNVCTMNEFREYLGLTPFKTFIEWNDDPKVAAAASRLYRNIDDLELYPGLLAETPKPSMPGSGTCTGHSIGRGILDDAISLVRSDRFLTHDFNTSTLTSWGKASLKPTPGAPGGYLGGLLFDAFPASYTFNSPFALLPFYTPQAAREILNLNGVVNDYDFVEKTAETPLKSFKTYDACKTVFSDTGNFGTLYNESIKQITGDRGFMIGFDEARTHDPVFDRMFKAFQTDNFDETVHAFVSRQIDYSVKKHSFATHDSVVRTIDIVRDVTNVVAISWIADRFAIPLKSARRPHGVFTLSQLRQMLLGLFIFSSMNVVPKVGWKLRETSLESADILTKIIKARVMTATGFKHIAADLITRKTSLGDTRDGEIFYGELAKVTKGISHDQVAGDVLGIMIPIAGNLTQQVSLIVEMYLRDDYVHHLPALSALSRQARNAANDERIFRYCMEAMRISPIVVGLPRVAKVNGTYRDGQNEVTLRTGDVVIIGTSAAHLDPSAFPEPYKVKLDRDLSKYILLGEGLHSCFGDSLTRSFLTASIRAIFKLNNIRKDPSPTGSFKRAEVNFADGLKSYVYLDDQCNETPVAQSLTVLWDAETKAAPVGPAAFDPQVVW
ncbi:hypothetical protein RQP46_006628 [Phenoliferia psychrophenolica]